MKETKANDKNVRIVDWKKVCSSLRVAFYCLFIISLSQMKRKNSYKEARKIYITNFNGSVLRVDENICRDREREREREFNIQKGTY